MNVASLELSKKLYEVSGWSSSDYYYDSCELVTKEVAQGGNHEPECEVCPAYDSGYLLRKLPPVVQGPDDKMFKIFTLWINGDSTVHVAYIEPYAHDDRAAYAREADTPEDALAKLAIELFEQGILTKA